VSINIVLVEPEIPSNAGNIARTCACTGMNLHLIHPLGFSTTDPRYKRSGADYWELADIYYHNSFDEFYAGLAGARLIFTSTTATVNYRDIYYQKGDYLVFGKESMGLADYILENYPGIHIRIPMRPKTRSLNLSNSVAIVAYEALAQLGFPGLV
jgi:tRNA (cytidine/uridine-2'-O-)-methyltransferase